MSEVRLSDACPDLVLDLESHQHVTDVIAFVLVTDVTTGRGRMTVASTGVDEIIGRGMIAKGVEMMEEQLAEDDE